jgi:hypothetical protein
VARERLTAAGVPPLVTLEAERQRRRHESRFEAAS